MKGFLTGTMAALFVVAAFFLPKKDMWFYQVWVGLLGITAGLTLFVRHRAGNAAALAFLIASVSGVVLLEGRPNMYWPVETTHRAFAGRTLVWLWAMTFMAGVMPLKWVGRSLSLFCGLAVADSVMVLIMDFWGPFGNGIGIHAVGTIDATFIATLMPLLLFTNWSGINSPVPRYLLSLVIPFAAIVAAEGTAGWVVFGVGVGWVALREVFRKNWKFGAGVLGAMVLAQGYAALTVGNHFTTSGRWPRWVFLWEWWNQQNRPWIGMGLGEYMNLGVDAQVEKFGKAGTFPWAHNDWGEVLFELGYLGLGAVVLLWLVMIWKSRHRSEIQATVIAYGVGAMAQMNLQFFFSALFGALLVRWVHERCQYSEVGVGDHGIIVDHRGMDSLHGIALGLYPRGDRLSIAIQFFGAMVGIGGVALATWGLWKLHAAFQHILDQLRF